MEVNKMTNEELLNEYLHWHSFAEAYGQESDMLKSQEHRAELLRRLEHGQGAQARKFRECARAIAQGYSNTPQLLEQQEAWVYSMFHTYDLIPAAPPEQPQGSGDVKTVCPICFTMGICQHSNPQGGVKVGEPAGLADRGERFSCKHYGNRIYQGEYLGHPAWVQPQMSAREFWPIYYKDDPNFPVSEAACDFAEAFARSREEEKNG